ncbi:MAG: FadR family transcriptional regulator [Acidobacteria bacterium]|nr:FadR family transcriptional regulator [Acidobacteriota bacterium]MCI0622690.1 FadR family transcriptional regulator [Acidobacteriota bacterium]MCI0717755.1 FadR family transcriptional regulator [Acidobacteriota bacterium]
MLTKAGSGSTAIFARNTLSAQTLQQLMGWLKDGTFKSGTKLPSQNELIEKFGVSRTGVREALQSLAALNLIEIRPGLGCFVRAISPEYIINADVLAVLLEKEAILQVIETRKVVEAGTAALATARATEEDFWLMEDVLGRVEKALARGESVSLAAAEFHVAVARASHNTVMEKLVRSFIQLMAKAGDLLETSTEDVTTFKQHELVSHRELYDVIRKGDPDQAKKAMVDHITYSEILIVEAFKQAEGIEN